MPNKYVVYDNEVFEQVSHPLFTTFKACKVPEVQTLRPRWNGKKIPLSMWHEILAFMKISYDKLKSETLLFLYYDEANTKSPWSYWVPPQVTSGMTVKSNPDAPDFSKQRAAYPDTLFGTVHHHCSTSAFQSGTDEADETNREGFHFTIGNLNNKDTCDIHLRCTLGDICVDVDDLSIILPDVPSVFKKSVKALTSKMQEVELEHKLQQYATLPDLTSYNFDAELLNVTKPTWHPQQTYLNQRNSNHQPFVTNSQQTAFNYGDAYWDNTEMTPVKYSKEQMEIDDIVYELIIEIESDDRCEESIVEYYTKFESKESPTLIEELIYGRTDNDEYERVIGEMLHNDLFLSTPKGKYFESFVTQQCAQNNTKINDVKNALFKYEIGETVQSMVDETIL